MLPDSPLVPDAFHSRDLGAAGIVDAAAGRQVDGRIVQHQVSSSPRPVHQVAIVAMGLPLIDVMELEAVSKEAAARKRWEFLLTAAPVPGAGRDWFSAQSDRDVLSDTADCRLRMED